MSDSNTGATTDTSAEKGSAKIYTRGGDKGKTSLIGGTRVSKSDLRLDAYGTIDELNSVIGVVKCEILFECPNEKLTLDELTEIQNDLFNVGSQLACEDPKVRTNLPGINDEKILHLETWMDRYSKELSPLKNFILPGGTRAASHAHVARTVARRAERLIVHLASTTDTELDPNLIRFVNRLSDYLFTLSRRLNFVSGVNEPTWGANTNP